MGTVTNINKLMKAVEGDTSFRQVVPNTIRFDNGNDPVLDILVDDDRIHVSGYIKMDGALGLFKGLKKS